MVAGTTFGGKRNVLFVVAISFVSFLMGSQVSSRCKLQDLFPAPWDASSQQLADNTASNCIMTGTNTGFVTRGVQRNATTATTASSPGTDDQETPQMKALARRESLRKLYDDYVTREVHFNNWNLGCIDLQFLAPYLRVINDRLRFGPRWTPETRVRRTIIDVGANAGDDASAILGIFQAVRGMCWMYGNPILLLSIEPSPKVFCEMTEALAHASNDTKFEEIQLLNIALSDKTGNLQFMDPGHEGGKLVASDVAPLDKMTMDEFTKATTCSMPAGQHKTMEIDWSRRTLVPTYTIDLLIESLEALGKYSSASDRIFVLKVDTEGSDHLVLKGAANLLQQHRIDFVVFETSLNNNLKWTVEYMSSLGYECYLIAPKNLIPLHITKWWYAHLDNFTTHWWGNCLCGIGNSPEMIMMWRMYHLDDQPLLNSYDIVWDRATTIRP